MEHLAQSGLPPLPLSVNVSRVHLYNPHLSEILCEITDRHHVPHALFNLEVTESVYTEHLAVIQESISTLHQHGFLVMMDDFGSEYSSLNVLKDVEFDVLKIDMRFFEDSAIKGRKENIIASVIRMAKWLRLPTIAEGVETKKQVDFLRDLGCEYVQGYYFAKPMPVCEYEALLASDIKQLPRETSPFSVNELWKSNDQIELMFSVVPQPMVLFEFNGNQFELLRVNQKYFDLFGYDNFSSNSLHWESILSPKYKEVISSSVQTAIGRRGESACDYLREYQDGTRRWIHVHYRYVNQIGGRHILLGTFSDITSEVQTKETLACCQERLAQLEAACSEALTLSRRDSLTEVYNRTAAEELVNEYLHAHPAEPSGFLMLDLDNFKRINDTYGHICGDAVLKETSQLLRAFFKNGEVVGRLGGDEFVVFLPDVRSEQLLLSKAQALSRALSQHELTDRKIGITITIGACISDKDCSFADLYSRADKALYKATRAGKTQTRLYHENEEGAHL